jgi:NitT/TauT family transport system permease protein
MRSWRKLAVEALAGLVMLFVLWEALVRLTGVAEFILPSPLAVFRTAYLTADQLAFHTVATISGTLISLGIGAALGMAVGLLIGYSQSVSRLLYPLLGGMQALPMSAFIPIFVVWFGVNALPKVVAGALIAFFPVVVNVVTGLRTMEPELWEMLRVLGASKAQVFHKVGIPRTLPYFFASLKVAAAGAFIGNVVGEMIAAGRGLGYVLVLATTSLNMPLAFAALTLLLLLGMTLFICFDILERRLAPWAFRNEGG